MRGGAEKALSGFSFEGTGCLDCSPVEYTTILYYTILCYAMLCNSMLCYAMLCYAMLHYTTLYYTILARMEGCCPPVHPFPQITGTNKKRNETQPGNETKRLRAETARNETTSETNRKETPICQCSRKRMEKKR